MKDIEIICSDFFKNQRAFQNTIFHLQPKVVQSILPLSCMYEPGLNCQSHTNTSKFVCGWQLSPGLHMFNCGVPVQHANSPQMQ